MTGDELRLNKKACSACHQRRARFRFAGRVRWNHRHNSIRFAVARVSRGREASGASLSQPSEAPCTEKGGR